MTSQLLELFAFFLDILAFRYFSCAWTKRVYSTHSMVVTYKIQSHFAISLEVSFSLLVSHLIKHSNFHESKKQHYPNNPTESYSTSSSKSVQNFLYSHYEVLLEPIPFAKNNIQEIINSLAILHLQKCH